jgi:ABC-type multidrug transport system fused ATPase/permease subunit
VNARLKTATAIKEFFRSRFSLQDNSLWRVMKLLRPYRRLVVMANIFLAFSQAMVAVGMVSLFPLFDYAIQQTSLNAAPAHVQAAESDATSSIAEKVLGSNVKKRQQLAKKTFEKGWLGKLKKRFSGSWNAFDAWAKASTGRFIALYSGFILSLFLVKGVIQFMGDFLMGKAAITVTADLMKRVYSNILRQELEFFDHRSTGSLLNTAYREVYNFQDLINTLASTRIMIPINIVILFGALMLINLPLSLMLLVMLPLVIMPTMMITRHLRRSLGQELGQETEIMNVMSQGIHGIAAIKAFGAEELEERQLAPPVNAYVQSTRARRAAQSIVEPVVDMLNMIVLLLIFMVAVYILPGRIMLSGGKLMVFLLATTRFYKPMTIMMKMNVTMQRSRALARRVFELLDRNPQIHDAPDAVDFPSEWKELRFNQVSFSYKVIRHAGKIRIRQAINGVNLAIRRGEAVAVVGPNGSGKSSIVKLMCRLYEPTEGKITIGGVPLQEIRLSSLREGICLITQQPVLFNRSVSENIVFNTPDVSQSEIERAALLTGADRFICKLPQDYDTFVGEDGRLLSGGERQKLVLARAFVRHPSILVLDEPTAGLDHQTVLDFLETLERLREQGITLLYITHEPSHLDRFDRVLTFHDDHTVSERAPQKSVGLSQVE